MNNKAAVRKELISQRNQLSSAEIKALSSTICDNLCNTDIYTRANNIGLYWSVKSEVATQDLLLRAMSIGKNCFLPVLHDKILQFAQLTSLDNLKSNIYGIPEPISSKIIEVSELDILIIPLVGYTSKGQRIGMGGGYYDRSLNDLDICPTLIGLAYSFQEITSCEFDSWDISLNIVVNEKAIIYCVDN